MRALISILLLAALLTSGAAAKSRSPCEAVTRAELARVLDGKPIRPDPSTVGEETAPSCIWTTRSGARVKIEIWHGDELSVVAEKSGWDYFVTRRTEALRFGGAKLVSNGEAAFRTKFAGEPSGEIGVLKDHRFLIFSFEGVPYRRALIFTKGVVRRS